MYQHNLQVMLNIIKPWGEVRTKLEGASFLNDFDANSIEFDSDLSVRLWKGLSIVFDLNLAGINDQIYLPAKELTLEDVLLNNTKLPTSFEVSGGVGLRLTFGSVYNNIVNLRL